MDKKEAVIKVVNRINNAFIYVFVSVLMLIPGEVLATESFKDILTKTKTLIGSVAIILGPGLGLAFGLQGIMKIRRKDDDPKEFSRGITLILVGVACAVIGVLINSILTYYGQSEININEYQ